MNAKSFLLGIFLIGNCILMSAQKPTSARDLYDWDAYSSKSTIKKDAISYQALQGVWVAHEGSTIGDTEDAWKSYNHPQILDIRGTKYKKYSAGNYYTFLINKNLLVLYTDAQPDSAYINLLTPTELTVSFRRGDEYVKNVYKKE